MHWRVSLSDLTQRTRQRVVAAGLTFRAHSKPTDGRRHQAEAITTPVALTRRARRQLAVEPLISSPRRQRLEMRPAPLEP